jgi:thiol:disulfide interchange protein DsbD
MLGFGLMFSYALGLGQLLIVLGVFTGLLYHFPRRPWIMKASKTILGFALIASGLFYISLILPKNTDLHKGPVENTAGAHELLPWQRYSEEALSQALVAGKPVMIDFYADWCLACKELEEKTFSDPGVRESLQDFVLLRFDATEESEALVPLRTKYKIVGLPTVVFYGRKGAWLEEKTLNEFEAPDKFVQRLLEIKQN